MQQSKILSIYLYMYISTKILAIVLRRVIFNYTHTNVINNSSFLARRLSN